MIEHHENDRSKAEKASLDQLVEAQTQDRWLSVAVSVNSQGILTVRETTWMFPDQDFSKVTQMLSDLLRQKIAPDMPEPLPTADFVVQKTVLDHFEIDTITMGSSPSGVDQ